MTLKEALKSVLHQDSPQENFKKGLSAVLIPLKEGNSDVYLTLAKRAGHLQHHAGEVGFPGGRFEKDADKTLLHTALREAEEELGIPPDKVEIAGRLRPVITAVTGFKIFPFVGIIPPDVEYHPNPDEVEKVFEVPLSFLLQSGALEEFEINLGNETLKNYRFKYAGEIVWGATARIIKQFLEVASPVLKKFIQQK